MRKCKGKYFENGGYKEFELGYFHQWGIDSEEVEEGVMNFTTAIVELSDGKIVTPVASDIKFIDKLGGEKYEKEIVEIAKSKEKSICDDFINKIVLPSYGMKCDNRCIECRMLVDTWLSKEYKEPEVDWSKVKVDTPILVSNAEDVWFERHFAKFEDETVYAWDDGRTSFTTEEYSGWGIAKLADDEDKEK